MVEENTQAVLTHRKTNIEFSKSNLINSENGETEEDVKEVFSNRIPEGDDKKSIKHIEEKLVQIPQGSTVINKPREITDKIVSNGLRDYTYDYSNYFKSEPHTDNTSQGPETKVKSVWVSSGIVGDGKGKIGEEQMAVEDSAEQEQIPCKISLHFT